MAPLANRFSWLQFSTTRKGLSSFTVYPSFSMSIASTSMLYSSISFYVDDTDVFILGDIVNDAEM